MSADSELYKIWSHNLIVGENFESGLGRVVLMCSTVAELVSLFCFELQVLVNMEKGLVGQVTLITSGTVSHIILPVHSLALALAAYNNVPFMKPAELLKEVGKLSREVFKDLKKIGLSGVYSTTVGAGDLLYVPPGHMDITLVRDHVDCFGVTMRVITSGSTQSVKETLVYLHKVGKESMGSVLKAALVEVGEPLPPEVEKAKSAVTAPKDSNGGRPEPTHALTEERLKAAKEEEAKKEAEAKGQIAKKSSEKAVKELEEEKQQRESKDKEAKEKAAKEKGVKEKEKERAAKEKAAKEKLAKEKEAKEKEAKEKEGREKQAKEKEAKEKEAMEKQAKEKEAKEKEAMEQQAKEKEAKEKEAMEKQAKKEKEAREAEDREKQAKERDAKENADEAKMKEAQDAKVKEKESEEAKAKQEVMEKQGPEAKKKEIREEAGEPAKEKAVKERIKEKEGNSKDSKEKESGQAEGSSKRKVAEVAATNKKLKKQ